MLTQRFQKQFSDELKHLQSEYEKAEANLEADPSDEDLEQLAEDCYENYQELYEKTYGICLIV